MYITWYKSKFMQIPKTIQNAVKLEESKKDEDFKTLVNIYNSKQNKSLFTHWCDVFNRQQRYNVKQFVGSVSWNDILTKIRTESVKY